MRLVLILFIYLFLYPLDQGTVKDDLKAAAVTILLHFIHLCFLISQNTSSPAATCYCSKWLPLSDSELIPFLAWKGRGNPF